MTAPRPLTAAAAAAAAAAEEAPLTQEQWRDFKSKERKSQRAQRRLDECVALLREAKLAHLNLRRGAGRARVRRGLAAAQGGQHSKGRPLPSPRPQPDRRRLRRPRPHDQPLLDRHEVVTIDGDVVTIRQATRGHSP